mgnify:CR=1 FL=1
MPSTSRSRSSSSATEHPLDDSVDGEGVFFYDNSNYEIYTSQMPDAPQPSQRREKYTPHKYDRKARKAPVIEAASEEEEVEEE